MTFGEKLAQVRKERGLKQKQLAELLDISPQVISQWETCRRSPTLKTIQKMARVLDVPPTELYPDMSSSDSTAVQEPAAGHGSAAANFNEALRQYIIQCVEAMDDRKALLELASDVERVLRALAEEEAEAELDR